MTRKQVVRELKFWFWFCSVVSITFLILSVLVLISILTRDLVLTGVLVVLVIVPFFMGLLFTIPINYSGYILNKKFGEKKYG